MIKPLTYICIYIRMCIIYTPICIIYIHVYVWHTCIGICPYMYIYIYIFVYIYILCMYVCMYMYVYIWYMHNYAYIRLSVQLFSLPFHSAPWPGAVPASCHDGARLHPHCRDHALCRRPFGRGMQRSRLVLEGIVGDSWYVGGRSWNLGIADRFVGLWTTWR